MRDPGLHPHAMLATIGMAVVAVCALTQMADLGPRVGRVEETAAAVAGVLINGFGDERVTVLTLLWLAAVITGALVRARVDLIAAAIFVVALGAADRAGRRGARELRRPLRGRRRAAARPAAP